MTRAGRVQAAQTGDRRREERRKACDHRDCDPVSASQPIFLMYSEQDLETAIQNAVARREAELRADFTQREAYYIQREEAFKARIKEMSEAWKKDVQLRIQELEAEEVRWCNAREQWYARLARWD